MIQGELAPPDKHRHTNMDTCIILNGPPGCGKDTLANILVDFGFTHHMMKEKLYEDTAAYFKVDLKQFTSLATDREKKESPWEELSVGSVVYTPREALIHVSEHIIKPNKGDDYFGKAAAKRCVDNHATNVVFSDGGFPVEVNELTPIYERLLVIRLHREGFTFDGDSRDYLQGFPNTHDVYLEQYAIGKAIRDIFYILGRLPE